MTEQQEATKQQFRIWIIHVRIAGEGPALRVPIVCACGKAECTNGADFGQFVSDQGLHATIEDRGVTETPGARAGNEPLQSESERRFGRLLYAAWNNDRITRGIGQAIKQALETAPATEHKTIMH